MTERPYDDEKGRIPAFKGCRSYSYIAQIDDAEIRSDYSTLAAILYRAGRFIEMAKTDGKSATARIIDSQAMPVCTISARAGE